MKTPIFTELEMLLIEASSALDNAEAASKLGGFSLPTTDIKTRLMEKVHELRMQRMNSWPRNCLRAKASSRMSQPPR